MTSGFKPKMATSAKEQPVTKTPFYKDGTWWLGAAGKLTVLLAAAATGDVQTLALTVSGLVADQTANKCRRNRQT